MKRAIESLTPSQFYRKIRPEYFSDSDYIHEYQLTREHLAFELSQISTNQKQDEFEVLCRRLAEKFIAPNLIPQVGPTGGGDGKTDSETYPVSTSISDRWFIPENGWDKDEKWAFAISSKAAWKGKAKGDIKKIKETERGYTLVYFISNQTISSKKKKDAQDEFKKEFQIAVVILDGEWILEKVFNNGLIDLVVDSLNLSSVYTNKKTSVGKNDASRIKQLEELEKKISSPSRYFEVDFQLVEDALESAIISRMLEKPRDEIEGKFDRALRFCQKTDNDKQWIRIHYQRAWTYLNWFDDYVSFIHEYKSLKSRISEHSNFSELELYHNLFNLLRGLHASGNCDFSEHAIEMAQEKKDLIGLLSDLEKNNYKPCTALIASTYKSIQDLMDSIAGDKDPKKQLLELSKKLKQGERYLDYPFESFKKLLEHFGENYPNHIEYDNLIDCIATISEKRTSELVAGEIFLRRGAQKLYSDYSKEAIIYFGKAVVKLSKEESQNGLYLLLRGLSQAYSDIGLYWASNNCLISASAIAFKSWYEKGVITKRIYETVKILSFNELMIGRIPSFLTWHELFQIIRKQINIDQEGEEIPPSELMDACFATRILNTNSKEDEKFIYLPDLLESQELWLSQNASFYKLGYIDLIIEDYKEIDITEEKELDDHYELIANQPFVDQMIYQTNFLLENQIKISSIILGCKFNISFEKSKELLFACETILAFLESFFATSLSDLSPSTEEVNIELHKNLELVSPKHEYGESSSQYKVSLNTFDFNSQSSDGIRNFMLEFTGIILSRNFMMHNSKDYLETLFAKEEVHERLSIIFEHRNFITNILGDNPSLFLEDWLTAKSFKEYKPNRNEPLPIKLRRTTKQKDKKYDLERVPHNKRKVFSIIDVPHWDKASWTGFGFFADNFGLGVFLAFENETEGKKIFDGWINRFGKIDEDEQIKITIIKGVDRRNPYWYRVHICSNIQESQFGSGDLFTSASRYHELNATKPNNLENLLAGYKHYKRYRLCLAKMVDKKTGHIIPYYETAIYKKELHIRNAWEIGENDMDMVVIKSGDLPIIPSEVDNAPVLDLLKKKQSK